MLQDATFAGMWTAAAISIGLTNRLHCARGQSRQGGLATYPPDEKLAALRTRILGQIAEAAGETLN